MTLKASVHGGPPLRLSIIEASQLFWVTTMRCNYESETIRANSECHHGSSLPQQSPFQSSPQAAPRHGFLSHSQSSQRFYHHGKWPAEVPPLGGAAAPPHLDFAHPVLSSLFGFAAITFFFLASLTVGKKKKPTCEIFDRYCPANLEGPFDHMTDIRVQSGKKISNIQNQFNFVITQYWWIY